MLHFGRRLWPTAATCTVGAIAGVTSYQSECSPGTREGRFAGKTILITGGGGTFGSTGAYYFVNEGANVCLIDVNKTALEKAAADVTNRVLKESSWLQVFQWLLYRTDKASLPQVLALPCDVRDVDAVAQVVETTAARFGKIDLLWNNAGYQGEMKPLLEYESKDVQMVMDVNVVGTFNVLQAVARAMSKQGGDGYAVVQTGSVAGLRGTPTMAAYSASKAAVHALTMTAAKDLAPHGIRVNTVMPALIGPEDGFMWARQNELHAKSGSPYFSRDAVAVGKAKVNGVPMKRIGTVEEVVSTVAFLLSGDSSYITGTSVVVAGGMA